MSQKVDGSESKMKGRKNHGSVSQLKVNGLQEFFIRAVLSSEP